MAGSAGATSSDQDDFTNQTVNSGTYATFATCNITTGGAGNYRITGTLEIPVTSETLYVSDAGTFAGLWRILENPNAHVVASGTFTVTATFNSGEGGAPFYTYDLTFGTALPSAASYADNETGATTIVHQLARASGNNTVRSRRASPQTTWT